MGTDGFEGFDFEDEDGDGQTGMPPEFRKWAKARDKAAKDLETKLTEANNKLAEMSLKDVLQEKGLNPGLSKWIVKDGVDASKSDAVDTWLTDNKDLIGYEPKAPDESDGQDDRAAAFAKMQDASQNAITPTKLSDIESRMNQIDFSKEDALQRANDLLVEAQRAAPSK